MIEAMSSRLGKQDTQRWHMYWAKLSELFGDCTLEMHQARWLPLPGKRRSKSRRMLKVVHGGWSLLEQLRAHLGMSITHQPDNNGFNIQSDCHHKCICKSCCFRSILVLITQQNTIILCGVKDWQMEQVTFLNLIKLVWPLFIPIFQYFNLHLLI